MLSVSQEEAYKIQLDVLFIILFAVVTIDIFLVRACVDVDKSLENEFLEMIEKERGELVEDEELTKHWRELEKLFMVSYS